MSVETDLYAYLEVNSAISDAVEDRIYPLTAPENCKTPYITYRNIIDMDLTSFQGDNYSNKTSIQLDIYSPRYSEVKAVAGAVKIAMYKYSITPHGYTCRDILESDTKLFRQLIEFKLIT
jgi:hypothetical protein